MNDFSIFYKNKFSDGDIPSSYEYDYFFSAYDDCERTKLLFEKICSKNKLWIIFPHYSIRDEVKNSYLYKSFDEDDDDFIQYIHNLKIDFNSKICIDITGYLRPHLIFFSLLLHRIGIKKIDYIYTEPKYYLKGENTAFSGNVSENPRIIKGCNSLLSSSSFEKDLLIINAGYDDKLISAVTKDKSKVNNKYLIIGFPSLQADMYQENILKINKAKDEIGQIKENRYAPANDPFITADAIKDIISENNDSSNIYLSPLSTKPQTLGMMLYFIWYKDIQPLNIIFPFSNKYIPKTAVGINYTWIYSLEFP
jgi:hypothetical protein